MFMGCENVFHIKILQNINHYICILNFALKINKEIKQCEINEIISSISRDPTT